MRFEKEAQQKEIRQEMKLRLARLQQQQHLTQNKPQIVIGEALLQHGALSRVTMATPSPLTPNSLDELLPSLDENQEVIRIVLFISKWLRLDPCPRLVSTQAGEHLQAAGAATGNGNSNRHNNSSSIAFKHIQRLQRTLQLIDWGTLDAATN